MSCLEQHVSVFAIDPAKVRNITSIKTLRDSRFRERNQILSLEDLASGKSATQVFNFTNVICEYNGTLLMIDRDFLVRNSHGEPVGVLLPKKNNGNKFVAVLDSNYVAEHNSKVLRVSERRQCVLVFNFNTLAKLFALKDRNYVIEGLRNGFYNLIDWSCASRVICSDLAQEYEQKTREYIYTDKDEVVSFSVALFDYCDDMTAPSEKRTQVFVENVCDDSHYQLSDTVGYKLPDGTYSTIADVYLEMKKPVDGLRAPLRRGNLWFVPAGNDIDLNIDEFPYETSNLSIPSVGLSIYAPTIGLAPCNPAYSAVEFYVKGGLVCFSDGTTSFARMHFEPNTWYRSVPCVALGSPVFN